MQLVFALPLLLSLLLVLLIGPPRDRGGQEIAAEVRRPVMAALARCTDKDIDLAGEALRPAARGRIHVFISTSDIHLQHKLKIGRDDCLELARAAVRRARRYTDDVE